jgi:hypothetical protein
MMGNQLKHCALALAMVAGWQMAAGANDGRPSRATLEAMGLSGMRVMSDDAAMAVRGFGFGSHAEVWGSSFANVAGHGASAGSKNGYKAEGPHEAVGANNSYANLEIRHSGGGHDDDDHGNHGGKKPPRDSGHDGGGWGDKGGGWGDKGGGKHGGGDKGGGWGDKGGGKHGGNKGGGKHGGGKPQVWSISVKAGGGSFAKAK